MSVEIKYKGNTIASANTEITKTIKTSGQYCEADIEVINTPDGGDAPVINPLSVTENGTYTAPSGVDGYSPVTVNVPQGITPSGTISITENGTYDVTEYASANVNVSGGAEITDGIVVKARDANGYATEVDYYLAADSIIPTRTFGTGTAGSIYLMTNAVTITINGKPTIIGDYAFSQLKKLATLNIDFGEVTSVGRSAFDTLSLLNKEISLPKCTSVGISAFGYSPHLSKIILPKITSFPTFAGSNIMKNCTGLTEVQLGSVDYTFTNLGTDAFSGCTQAGLTITVYSNGANADNVLTRIRNGATNATIIIKASEDTTYGGASYSAGDTMITSTP